MLLLNIILVIALLGFVGTGLKDGFIHTLGRIVGAILGFLAARAWSIGLAPLFAIVLPYGWARLVAFLVILLIVTRLVGWLFKLADGAFRIISFIPFLKSINNVLGAILGIVEGILVLGGTMWTLINFNLIANATNYINQSTIAHWILIAFQKALAFVL